MTKKKKTSSSDQIIKKSLRLDLKEKIEGYSPKLKRSYIQTATKAATHPVRSSILKSLKESSKSTIELENVTGEARYNLYHHLDFLENAGLIGWKFKDNDKKAKIYSLGKPERPEAAVVVFDEADIKSKPKEFVAMIDSVSSMEGTKIPHKKRIEKVEICLYYSEWPEKKV